MSHPLACPHQSRSGSRRTSLALLTAVALALPGCGTPTPPKPPAADPSSKRPVNDPQALEIQWLRHQLRNSELMRELQEKRAQAESLVVPVTRTLSSSTATPPQEKSVNRVFVVTFGHGQTRIELSQTDDAHLIEAARSAAYLQIRGRTDGLTDTPGEARIARERAVAMRDFLIGRGVSADRIRVSHQPSGDHLADNGTGAGRDLNRRVEVELYPVKPTVLVLGRDASS